MSWIFGQSEIVEDAGDFVCINARKQKVSESSMVDDVAPRPKIIHASELPEPQEEVEGETDCNEPNDEPESSGSVQEETVKIEVHDEPHRPAIKASCMYIMLWAVSLTALLLGVHIHRYMSPMGDYKVHLLDQGPMAEYDVNSIFGQKPMIKPHLQANGDIMLSKPVSCPAEQAKKLVQCSPTGPIFRIRAGKAGKGRVMSCSCKFKINADSEVERACYCTDRELPLQYQQEPKAPLCSMKEHANGKDRGEKPKAKYQEVYHWLYESTESIIKRLHDKGMVLLRTSTVRLQYWTVIVREYGWSGLFMRPYQRLLG